MAEQRLDILLKAVDEASAVVDNVTKRMEGLTDQLRDQVKASKKAQSTNAGLRRSFVKTGKKLKSMGNRFHKATEKIATFKGAMVGLAVIGGLKILKGAIDDAATFEGALGSLGKDVEATERRLRALQAASDNMFSLETLVSAEAKLRALGVPLRLTPTLLKNITSSSASMGITTEHALDSLARGLGRNSKMILDNIGVVYESSAVYSAFASSIGKTSKELTTQEKRLAVVRETQKQLGISTDGVSKATKASMQMNALWADTMLKIKRLALELVPAFSLVIKILAKVVDHTTKAIENIMKVVRVAVSAIKAVKEVADDVIEFGGYVADEVSNVVGFVADAGSTLARVTGVKYAFDFIGLGGSNWAEEFADQAKRMNQDLKDYERSAKDVTAQQFHLNRELEREVVVLRQLQEAYPKLLSFKQEFKIKVQDAIDQERYLVQVIKQHAKWEQEAWEQATEGAGAFLFQLFEVGKTMDGLNQMLTRFMAGTGEFAKRAKGTKGATQAQINLARWLAAAKIQLATMVDEHEAKLFQFRIQRMELEAKLAETKNKASKETIKGQIKMMELEQNRYKLAYEMGQVTSQAKVGVAGAVESTAAAGAKAQVVVDIAKEKGVRKTKIEQMMTENELVKTLLGFQLKGDALRLQLAGETNKVKQAQIKTELELLDIAGKQAVADQKKQDEAGKFYDLAAALDASASSMAEFSANTATVIATGAGLSDMIGKVTDGSMTQTQAVESGIGLVGTGIASFVDGEKEKAAVLALMETAQGFATLATPWVSAGHFAAAALFGAVAGGLIGGGGAAVAGGKEKEQQERDRRAREGGGGGGQASVVVNYNSGIVMGGQQTIARALAAATNSISKTGQMASAF